MSDFGQCRQCKEWVWLSTHRCPPTWQVRLADDERGDDMRRVYARDAEKAAEKFSAERDAGEGEWQNSRSVIVRDAEGRERAYTVDMQPVPEYTAWTVEDWSAPKPEPGEEPEPEESELEEQEPSL